MSRLIFRTLFIAILFSTLFAGCSRAPITGRKQLILIPNSEVLSLGASNYKEVINTSKLSANAEQSSMVKKVGNNIQVAVQSYMQQNNMSDRLNGYQWEFNLIEDKTVNAWCMPGGKVAFYTGIMPVCNGEAGVAAVMGHEVAHAVANHGSERMSQALLQEMGGVALAVALQDKPQETQLLFNSAYAVGTTVGAILPYSRLHETEADKMGMIFMAMAGYDPNEAVKFWERMAAQSRGAKPPEFLSTHPADGKRIAALKSFLPEAMKYYHVK